MRKAALYLAAGLCTAGLATAAMAQPAPDEAPPGAMAPPPGGPGMAPPPGTQGPGAEGPGAEGMAPPHGMRAKFEAANVTHDGRLTLEQAQAAGLHGVAKHFAQIDRDNKGYVTLQDIKAFHQAQHAAHAAAMQGQPPVPTGAPPAGQQPY